MVERGGRSVVARLVGWGTPRVTRYGVGLGLACMLVPLLAAVAQAEVYSYRDRRGTQHFTNVPTDRRFRPVQLDDKAVGRISYARSTAPRPRRSGGSVHLEPLWQGAPEDLHEMIDETARRYGVEPALVHAVVRAESGFDHLAVSSKGASGLMQLMPATASEVGVRDIFHPQDNLKGGVYYLRQMLDRFSGDVRLALAAYNAGPGAVERSGGIPPYAETIEYVQRVLRYRQEHLLRGRVRAPQRRFVVASR